MQEKKNIKKAGKVIRAFVVVSLILFSISGYAQNYAMVHSGEIQFERRVNAYAILDKYYIHDKTNGTDQFAFQYKAEKPQFGVTNFTLLFDDEHALYAPDLNVQNVTEVSLLKTANVVYSDLKNRMVKSRRQVFDNDFLILDSLRHIQWKITDETREIAGFSCRRANALIFDSVYVVAFYADQIVPTVGPELFNGLPGMILGVVLPHEHMSWFATKVTVKPLIKNQVQAPKNGKPTDYSELLKYLLSSPNIKINGARQGLLLKNYMY